MVFFMIHTVGQPTHSTISQFHERYDSVLNYVLVSAVWCIRLVALEIMEKEKRWLCTSEQCNLLAYFNGWVYLLGMS